MDPETMYDSVANVGVKDGRIAVITKDTITGRETIDATGHVVAPGFIDTHNHWQRVMGYKIALDGCLYRKSTLKTEEIFFVVGSAELWETRSVFQGLWEGEGFP
jgi:adenine deaminase